MVPGVLCPELTSVLLASRPVADQEPEIGSEDPQVARLGTVPDTVTVIEALAPLASVKPVQVTVWLPLPGLMLTVPVAGLVVAVAFDSHPAVPPWIFLACRSPPVQFCAVIVKDQLPDVPGVPVWLGAFLAIVSPEPEQVGVVWVSSSP
jgi:hypothetical protein